MKTIVHRSGAAAALAAMLAAAPQAACAQSNAPAGKLVCWGQQTSPCVPTGQRYAAIAGGADTSLALSSNGTVIAWGYGCGGQCDVPSNVGPAIAISGNTFANLALRADHTVVAWGENGYGQTNVPAGLTGVTAIAGGGNHCLALKSDGTVVAWGSFSAAIVPAGLSGVRAIAAGGSHCLALLTNGTVVAWGDNNNGQCTVPGGLAGVTAVAAGYWHSLALKSDGTVVGWGDNEYGESAAPAGLSGVVAIAAQGYQSLALRADGALVPWGVNNGAMPAGLTNVTAIALGEAHALALRPDGSIVAWGVNTYGQCRVPGSLPYFTQIASGYSQCLGIQTDGMVLAIGGDDYVPAGLGPCLAVACGYYHSLALENDGAVICWGTYYEPANGGNYVQATAPNGLSQVSAIAAGWNFDLALKSDGTVAAWGDNSSNQADVPAGLSRVVALAAGGAHSLALKSDGTVVAWGSNGNGESSVPAGLGNVVRIAAGRSCSLAQRADGTVVAWGDNSSHELDVPAVMGDVVVLASGGDNFLALKADGSLTFWGENDCNESALPAGLGAVIAVAAGGEYCSALVEDASATPALLSVSPPNQTAGIGCTVSIASAAVGAPPLSYRWLFEDSTFVPGATNAVLELVNAQPVDAGVYRVVVSNETGTVTSGPATLNLVETPPLILNSPASQSIDAGLTAELIVTVTGGCQPLFYQWYFERAPLDSQTNAQCTLPGASPAESGPYWVVVTTVYGAATSAPATLTVKGIGGIPPAILSPPASQTGYLDGAVSFAVAATGSPLLSYQWCCNGGALAGSTNTYLDLNDLQFTNSGDYTVIVTNLFGATTSSPASLSVVPGPSYVVLHHFGGPDGVSPCGDLILLGSTLFGTAMNGGITNNSGFAWGNGTVFKVGVDGDGFALLRQFEGGLDGCFPQGGLVASGATLFGTTSSGGGMNGPGTLFQVNADGSGYAQMMLLPTWPEAGLTLVGTNLYGTTEVGGQYGDVFAVNTNGGAMNVLHYLDTSTGVNPRARLVAGGDTLYGDVNGCGGVFKLDTDGSGFAMLSTIPRIGGCPRMQSRLVVSGTNIFGTAFEDNFYGLVFAMGTDGGGFNILRSFTNHYGAWAGMGGLALSGTTLYGTRCGSLSDPSELSVGDFGDVFLMNTSGRGYTILKTFTGGADGAWPGTEILLSEDTLYGTTTAGGLYNDGVIFALGFPPAISADPQTQTAEAGSMVALSASVTGSAAIRYQWFFNGALQALATNAVLRLNGARLTDAGVYTVVATNVFGSATSAPAGLSVIPFVPRRIVPGLRFNEQDGSVLNFEQAASLCAGAPWTDLDEVTATGVEQWYFDLKTSPGAEGFYRAWLTNAPSAGESLSFALVPALTLAGQVGASVRIDCIDTIGPTNAWTTLNTVTLTNASQLYFDTNAPGQPARLWRVVAMP